MKEWNLSRLKEEFSKLEKKYKLPEFKKLNEEFDIEKIAGKETDFILREIRKSIADKIISYIRFLEILINPANGGPMFFFMIVKGMNANNKNLVDEIYKKLARFELDAISLDNNYSEKSEAEFIEKIYKEWQSIKEEIEQLSSILKENWEKEAEKSEKSYFG